MLYRLVNEFSQHHDMLSTGNSERHLSNPVNAFILTNKMFDLVSQATDMLETRANANLESELYLII